MNFEEEFPSLKGTEGTSVDIDLIREHLIDKKKVKAVKDYIRMSIQDFFVQGMDKPELTNKDVKSFMQMMIKDPILLNYVDEGFKELGL